MTAKSPKYTYLRKGRWVYIPYVDGKLGKEIPLRFEGKLIREHDPMSRVWAAYEGLINTPSDTLAWLIDTYLKSPSFEKRKPRTKRDYKSSALYLKTKKLKNKSIFGDVAFEAITTGTITKLHDTMNDSPVAAKHRIQFLKTVFSWGYARDICSKNPCKGAARPVEEKKKKKVMTYVEDESYYYALSVARELKSYLYPIMILAYCCRARVGEISRLEYVDKAWLESGFKQSDVNEEGIYLYRSKGSLPEVTLWSDFLREGYRAALEYSKKQDNKNTVSPLIKDPYLIHDSSGRPIKKNSFDSAWGRLVAKCKKNCAKDGVDYKRFSIHELKAKGIDDHEMQDGGHKTESAKAIYLRKIKRTKSTI